MKTIEVDVVILTRGIEPIPERVLSALERQEDVKVRLHRVVGASIPEDKHRLDTIVRARNEGKLRGSSRWLMFLDDDVVLEDDCITKLVAELSRRSRYGALAADYLSQSNSDGQSRHVAMGATLFRRHVLEGIQFRYQSGLCECQCCCDDLRSRGFRIAYSTTARAQHIFNAQRALDLHDENREQKSVRSRLERTVQNPSTNRVLTCFDRNHLHLFRRIFLPSLRAAGNHEPVSAVTYGLDASEASALAALPGVCVFNHPASSISPAKLRLEGFRQALEDVPSNSLVAYWDAGDTVFQRSLRPLWNSVQKLGDRLGIVAEPNGQNRLAIDIWTRRIHDRRGRAMSYRVMEPRAMLNGGFAASRASVLVDYLQTATKLLDTWLLRGTGGYDQNALNIYCHFLRRPYALLDEGWNFCVFGRRKGSILIDSDSRFVKKDGSVIPVVHGNACTLSVYHDRIVRSLPTPESLTSPTIAG